MSKKDEALKLAEDVLKRVRTQDMELVQLSMIALVAIREALASEAIEKPAPPPECQTEAEKTAYAFGWFKALESVRKRPAEQKPMTTQTEADRLANQLDYHREYDLGVTHTGIDEQAAAELRRQQAEIERLNEALAEQPAPMIRGDIRDGLVDDEPAQQEPVAWVYSEGLEALKNGKPWTAYGTKQEANNIALYLHPTPECEPYAWVTFTPYGDEDDVWYENPEGQLLEGWTYKPLYDTAPPRREWVGLTDVEIASACKKNGGAEWWWRDIEEYGRAIEAKLKEKNT